MKREADFRLSNCLSDAFTDRASYRGYPVSELAGNLAQEEKLGALSLFLTLIRDVKPSERYAIGPGKHG